ncbi:hypothetical protein HS088_TW19G00415 [Tripterygium wilfordii]|uniref:Nal1 C-terminal domain-containing protein n=1 Tax=Tripterygium wilfordii TaxID=458696 RepID=A0A7J7CA59_TRIWF|nr:hypothetical protein HS088_TW19G00415 [Tripterygium wilfordii]
MERSRHNMRARCSGSTPLEESALDVEKNGCNNPNLPLISVPTLQLFASAGQHCESNAAYFSWPTSSRLNDAAVERANYFSNLQKGGPGGVWCDVDVVEFSYFGAPEPAPKEQLYTEIVNDLHGGNMRIGSGSQVASQEKYGTLGAIVRSITGNPQVGFLTNRHVAVDIDYPNQKMFHPLPPTLGPGVYLGAVEKATSFITDDLWYGIFAGMNPGDSGSLIMMKGETGQKPQPIGIIWGGTTNRGRVKLKFGQHPENWTRGVDLGRLLNILELDLITTNEGLKAAVQEQRAASVMAICSMVGGLSPLDGNPPYDKTEDTFEPLGIQIEHMPMDAEQVGQGTNPLVLGIEFHLEEGIRAAPSIQHQFIPSFIEQSPVHQNKLLDKAVSENLASLRNGGCDEDASVSLHLGDMEAEGRHFGSSTNSAEEPKMNGLCGSNAGYITDSKCGNAFNYNCA